MNSHGFRTGLRHRFGGLPASRIRADALTRILLPVIAVVTTLGAPITAGAQIAVIDNANLVQNVVQAARELQQINNQIQSLQNEALMLQNEARNLAHLNFSSLTGITDDLQRIGSLMNQAQGIGFNVQSVEAAYSQNYPRQYGSGTPVPQLVAGAESRWQDARDAFRQTMTVQSRIAQTVQSDTGKLAALVNASQGAAGTLQASRATNQLLALSIKQQMQAETLMAAEDRAQALTGANDTEAKAEGRAAFKSFLGSSTAYSP